MGFWHTGYMDHFETGITDPFVRGTFTPEPVSFPCSRCNQVFDCEDDLARHLFDGHASQRPLLLLRGRECGRSRLSIVGTTRSADWKLLNVTKAAINGFAVDVGSVPQVLSECVSGVVAVELSGGQIDQQFEFSLEVADPADLDGVESRIDEMIVGKALTLGSLQGYIDATASFRSAHCYRDGVANYFYGVLAREDSPESGLAHLERDGVPAYRSRFDDAASALKHYDRPYASAITGLIALHYNQFATAATRTQSARVAAVSHRLGQIVAGGVVPAALPPEITKNSLDYVLSDSASEQVLQWCSCPLDASSEELFTQVEQALDGFDALDQLKLRLTAAEYYLRVGRTTEGLRHHRELRHNLLLDEWSDRYRDRAAEGQTT